MRINRKIVVSLNIRTSKDGKYCSPYCDYEKIECCSLYGELEYSETKDVNIRHPKCIKDEVSEDYYKKEKK